MGHDVLMGVGNAAFSTAFRPEMQDTWEHAMRAGRHEAAWAISDHVLADRDPATRDQAGVPYHQRWVWDGGPVEGRHVLVRCYHGLGDTLQYARFLPALRARAASVTVEAQPELLPLVASLASAVAFDPARPLASPGCDLEIMELSHALRLKPADVPASYLPLPPAGTPRDAIALCWQSGGWDPERSIPLDLLRAALPSGRLLSLQRGPAAAEASDGFLNPYDNSADIIRTVALIAAARRGVTVDSMVVHLAGALGRPVLLLLKHEADWRWGDTGRTAWYPSARLLRQHRHGDWTAPLAELAAMLRQAG